MLIFVFIILIYVYSKGFDNGYRAGHRKGFEGGKRAINEYVLKINHAQGERIVQLNAMINKGKDEVV